MTNLDIIKQELNKGVFMSTTAYDIYLSPK